MNSIPNLESTVSILHLSEKKGIGFSRIIKVTLGVFSNTHGLPQGI